VTADRTPRREVVECANSACTIQFERPVGVRGGVRRFCSPLCRNFARLMVKAAAQPQVRPFTYAPAPNRAAQPIHETDAHSAGDAVNYAHDHEVLRHSPIEPVTGATAHSTASNKQQPTNKHAQKQGRENL
jgi:hypothetical protein